MAAKKHFIEFGVKFNNIDEYLSSELWRAGYGGVDLHKTPIGYRLRIHAARPGMVIGRRGRMIRRLTEILQEEFGLENPQLEVEEIQNAELNARVMAYRLIGSIERGYHFRRAAYSILRRVMDAGARGCEIVINGKLSSQRGRSESFRQGFVAKSGTPADVFVDAAVAKVTLKPGQLGVHVRIMQPGKTLPDEIKVIPPEIKPEEEIEDLSIGEKEEEPSEGLEPKEEPLEDLEPVEELSEEDTNSDAEKEEPRKEDMVIEPEEDLEDLEPVEELSEKGTPLETEEDSKEIEPSPENEMQEKREIKEATEEDSGENASQDERSENV